MLEVEAYLSCQGPWLHVMRAAERGQEVVQRVLVGHVNGSELQTPLVSIALKQIVVP